MSFSLANIYEMLLRAKNVIVTSFIVIFLTLLALLATRKDKYEAHMSFLLRSARAESLVSADPGQNAAQPESEAEAEQTINSEVELLNNVALLRSVALDNGLEKPYLNSSQSNRAVAIERATRDLSKQLKVNAVRRSNIIDISYVSSNRDQAKSVLDSLSREYLQQYSKLYHTTGAAAFYKEHSNVLSARLRQAEDERASLLQKNGYTLLPEGQSLSLNQIVDLKKSRGDVLASLAETDSRLRNVVTAQERFADRQVTQRKMSASPISSDQLNAKLVDLQNRRTELLSKFVDNDPLVLQVQQQIQDTQAALTAAGKLHFEDVTTDVNPIRQSLDLQATQLAQTRAGLTSRLKEIDEQLRRLNGELDGTQSARIELDKVDRGIKVLQDGVALYENKGIVASASEEMNARNFNNVVEASYPTVPVLPIESRFTLGTSFLLSLVLSLAIGLAYAWWSQTSRSRVLPTVPTHTYASN